MPTRARTATGGGYTVGELGNRLARRQQPGLAVNRVDRGVAEQAVGDARGMGEQIGDGDRALGVFHRRMGGSAAGVDLGVREGRDELRDRVVEAHLALLDQLHDRRRGDWLGHRIDPEHGLLADRALARRIERTGGGPVSNFAVPRHDGDDPSEPAGIDPCLEGRGNPLELHGRELDVVGTSAGKALGRGGRGVDPDERQNADSGGSHRSPHSRVLRA